MMIVNYKGSQVASRLIQNYQLSIQKDISSAWLKSNTELCLFVSSAASPGGLENIVVINPNQPQIRNIKLVDTIPKIYNERAFQGLF